MDSKPRKYEASTRPTRTRIAYFARIVSGLTVTNCRNGDIPSTARNHALGPLVGGGRGDPSRSQKRRQVPSLPTTTKELSSTDVDAVLKLRDAIRSGARTMFNSLLREDTPVNIADDGGKFPLHHAVEKRDMQMIKDLIRFGADVDAADRNKQPALHLLAQPRTKGLLQPTRDIVDTLMAEGEDASAQDVDGNTPLHFGIPPSIVARETQRIS